MNFLDGAEQTKLSLQELLELIDKISITEKN